MTTLTTQRLTLRPTRISDTADMHRIFSDPRAMRYWSTAPATKIEETDVRIAKMIPEPGTICTYFIFDLGGKAIGSGGMYTGNEVGFILHPDYWRQGYASEAMGAIIPYLFEVTEVDSLTADVDPRNAGSIGILTALGFGETHRASKTFFINDEWCDSIYFSLPRPAP